MTPEFRIQFTKETEELLKSLDKEIELARTEIERAKRLGIDVSDLEEQLKKAIEIRDDLLRRFGSQGQEQGGQR